MITIILTRFPLSSEALGPRVVLYEFLGADVSLGPWEPLAQTKTSSTQFCYSYQSTGLKFFFETISLYLVRRRNYLSSFITLPNPEEMSFIITN